MTKTGFDGVSDATHGSRFDVGAISRAGLLKRAALLGGGAVAAGGFATALARDASRRVVDPRSFGWSRPTPEGLGPPLRSRRVRNRRDPPRGQRPLPPYHAFPKRAGDLSCGRGDRKGGLAHAMRRVLHSEQADRLREPDVRARGRSGRAPDRPCLPTGRTGATSASMELTSPISFQAGPRTVVSACEMPTSSGWPS